jgi:hypothetical protein
MEEELLADKNAKLQLAIDGILSWCASRKDDDDPPLQPELQRIHQVVNVDKSDQLVSELLTGFSNYTYKIFLEKDPDNSAIFAKVALTYALWNPDRSAIFALDRSNNEKKIMEFFLEKFQDTTTEEDYPNPPVCQPYFIMDLSPEARLLCNRFEQKQRTWDAQFVDGIIDKRLIARAARFIASVNLTSLDEHKSQFPTEYNDGIKETYRSVCPVLKAAFEQIAAQPVTPQNQHFMEYAQDGGVEAFAAAIDNSLVQYEEPDVLLHGDFHVLNILVEDFSENDNGDVVSFGPNGSLHICDWDMSHVGTLGRDIGALTFFRVVPTVDDISSFIYHRILLFVFTFQGPFHPFPIVCAYFLAAQGKTERANACIDSLWAVWENYAEIMGEKSPLVASFESPRDYLLKLYRSCLGWCGVYGLGANVILKVQSDHFPFDRVSDDTGAVVMASYSLTGLKALEWGFLGNNHNPEFSVDELQKWFRDIIEEQIDFLAKYAATRMSE